MNIAEAAVLKFCKKIVNQLIALSGKTVLKHSLVLSDKDTVEAEVVTEEEDFQFTLHLREKEKGTSIEKCWYPVWYDEEENYFAVVKNVVVKGYVAVQFEEIDLDLLKFVLEGLASDHVKYIIENNNREIMYKDGIFPNCQEQLTVVLLEILDKYDNEIDTNAFIEGVTKLVTSTDVVFNSANLYVKCNKFPKQLFVKNTKTQPKELKILKIGQEVCTPLVYDVILTIFSITDQIIRKNYFHELVNYYYGTLQDKLSVSLDLTVVLSQEEYYRQVNMFLPYVKLETLKGFCREFYNEGERKEVSKIWPSVIEMNECFLYPNLSREDCYKIVENKIGSTDYSFSSYKLIPLDSRPGFLGDYFKAKIHIRHNNEDEVLNLFLKYLPTTGDFTRELAFDSFTKEEFFYREFIPELMRLGLKDICDFLPKCYFSRTTDVLIFEDVSLSRYDNVHISDIFTYNLLSIAVKSLAKMHACSLLYEEVMTSETKTTVRIDEVYGEYIKETFFNKTVENMSKKVVTCALRTILQMVDLFPDIPKSLSVEEFKEHIKTGFEVLYEKVKKSDKYRNVICHGDFWSANILFKRDEHQRAIDCCIVDYQLTRYCPPAGDLLFMMYMTTNKTTRQKYMAKLIHEYYTELSNILERYSFDLSGIYTYDQFLESCNYMKSYAVCHTAVILQVCLCPEEKMKHILSDSERATQFFCVERKEVMEEMLNEGQYRARMKELIEELYDICENGCL